MSDDVMLLGVLRMPWDTRGDLTLVQVQERCRQAADKIEALERDAKRYEAWKDYWFDPDDDHNQAINWAKNRQEMDAALDTYIESKADEQRS